jgi:hypothetical protein
MSLVLTYCWREWRAQRGMLCAYAVLVFAALVLIALLMPRPWWLQDGRAGVALAAFAIAGGFGVLGFVAAALVRSEFGSKDDQFVLRLPGALLPSFGGKLLFLVLVTAALPVLGLALGQLLLQALELETAWPSGAPGGEGSMLSSWPMVWSLWAALGIPWVWAIGTWLPKGRMALGGTVLFVLLLGLLVAAVLRQSPGLEDGIAWRRWVPYVPVLGIAVAFVSWAIGRRGGGPLRSARFGLAASALGLAAPAAWFAVAAWDYHHPDLQRPAQLRVSGLSPDGRYVLASLATHPAYSPVACRIDLQDGSAVHVAGVHGAFTPALATPHVFGGESQRLWRWLDYRERGEPKQHTLLDLATGERVQVASDPGSGQPSLPASWRELAAADAAATTPLRGPGDVRFWFEGTQLCWQAPNGPVQRETWSHPLPSGVRAAGHGFEALDRDGGAYDFVQRRFVPDTNKLGEVLFVRGRMLVWSKQTPQRWLDVDPRTKVTTPIAALQRANVLGLIDDDRLLCARGTYTRQQEPELFTWCPADDAIAAIELPAGADWSGGLRVVSPGRESSSMLPRDPRGRLWFAAGPWKSMPALLTLEPNTGKVAQQPPHLRFGLSWSDHQLLAWSADDTWLLQDGRAIVRLDLATGSRTQLFPQRAEERR